MEAERALGPAFGPPLGGADPDQVWEHEGWGAPLTWATRSRAGDRLAFSLRLPLGWRTSELIEPGGEATASGAGRSLGAWAKLPGAITAQRLALVLPLPAGRRFPVLATLIATLGAVEGSPADGLSGEGARTVTVSGLEGVRLRAVRGIAGAGASVSILVVQHLLATRYGALSVAFSAPQAPFHEKLERLFDQVAQTIELDPSGAD
jgi:hypothetical protein